MLYKKGYLEKPPFEN